MAKRNRVAIPSVMGVVEERAIFKGRNGDKLAGFHEPKRANRVGYRPLRVNYSHR